MRNSSRPGPFRILPRHSIDHRADYYGGAGAAGYQNVIPNQIRYENYGDLVPLVPPKLVGGLSAKDAGIFAKEMNCEPEFLQNIRKAKGYTQFPVTFAIIPGARLS